MPADDCFRNWIEQVHYGPTNHNKIVDAAIRKVFFLYCTKHEQGNMNIWI